MARSTWNYTFRVGRRVSHRGVTNNPARQPGRRQVRNRSILVDNPPTLGIWQGTEQDGYLWKDTSHKQEQE